MLSLFSSIVHWLLTWVYFVAIICFIGACVGVVSHLLFGLVFSDSPDYAYFASFGFMNGLQYGGVWAGGFSIVLCVMRAHKQHAAKKESAA